MTSERRRRYLYFDFWEIVVVFSTSGFDKDRVTARAVLPLYWNGSGGFLGWPLFSEIDRIGICSIARESKTSAFQLLRKWIYLSEERYIVCYWNTNETSIARNLFNQSYLDRPGLGVVQASTSQMNIESPILTTCMLSSVKKIFRIGSECPTKLYNHMNTNVDRSLRMELTWKFTSSQTLSISSPPVTKYWLFDESARQSNERLWTLLI